MKKNKDKNFRLNTLILTKVKVKLINYVSLPDRYSNNLRCVAIWLRGMYVCDDSHDEILETTFLREELNYDKLFW